MLERLGENHVIAVQDPDGEVLLRSDCPASSFELLLAVGRLTVDESALRERYGEQFASPPAEADIAGTRDTMLAVAAYTDVRTAGHLAAGPDGDAVTLEIALKDTVVLRSVQISLEMGADSLWTQSAIQIDHAEQDWLRSAS